MQPLADTVENEPAEQSVQFEAPSDENVPAPHDEQLTEPVTPAYVPPTQFVQLKLPSLLVFPTGQSVQLYRAANPALTSAKVPASQNEGDGRGVGERVGAADGFLVDTSVLIEFVLASKVPLRKEVLFSMVPTDAAYAVPVVLAGMSETTVKSVVQV